MKRRTAHALFGVVAFVFTGMLLQQALKLQHAKAVNQAMALASTQGLQAASHAASSSDISDPHALPEARLTRAHVLSLSGQHDAAIKLYSRLLQDDSPSGLRLVALYNLANVYLRQGMAGAPGDSVAALELAKQRYRELLRTAPQEWDARYNLERALRLAPENEAAFADENVPVEQRRVRMRGMKAGDLP
ncbi:MxaK protein [Ideonella azotifigens]|nr:MxaK protein [Ideonella azotifigens]MCD2340464.1 MxaK protein [Ideonella azotifigens]